MLHYELKTHIHPKKCEENIIHISKKRYRNCIIMLYFICFFFEKRDKKHKDFLYCEPKSLCQTSVLV
jgi:hypothetical protein